MARAFLKQRDELQSLLQLPWRCRAATSRRLLQQTLPHLPAPLGRRAQLQARLVALPQCILPSYAKRLSSSQCLPRALRCLSKKALDSLTSGDHVGTFSCHGIEPAPGKDERGSVAKINQDCACIAHPINGDRNAALL